MTSPGSGSRLPSATLGRVARLALAIVTILSVCVLFVQVWSPLTDDVNFSANEKNGIQYLTALTKVSTALADAESSAVAGDTVSGDDLTSAVDAVTAVDSELGTKLGSKDRWASLRTKIKALPNRDLTDSNAVYSSYTQVTDLLLALYDEVRDKADLSRDPDAVSFFLQDAATAQLPQVIIRAGRYNDLAVLAEKLPAASAPANATSDETAAATAAASTARSRAAAAVVTARAQVAESAAAVVDDLTDAVDKSSSSTFGTDILQQLDSFKRAADQLAPSTPGLIFGAVPYSVEIGKSRDEVESSAADLDSTIYNELKTTIDDRQSSDQRSRVLAALSFLVALALIVVLHAIAWMRRRPGGKGGRVAGQPAAGSGFDPPHHPDERNGVLVPGYGDIRSSRRERSGAPR
jgi:hypothetical protein